MKRNDDNSRNYMYVIIDGIPSEPPVASHNNLSELFRNRSSRRLYSSQKIALANSLMFLLVKELYYSHHLGSTALQSLQVKKLRPWCTPFRWAKHQGFKVSATRSGLRCSCRLLLSWRSILGRLSTCTFFDHHKVGSFEDLLRQLQFVGFGHLGKQLRRLLRGPAATGS